MHHWIAIVCLTSILLTSSQASAQFTTTDKWQVGIATGYGFSLEGGEDNPWGFGLGLRLGFTTVWSIYLGTLLNYHFGTTEDLATLAGTSELVDLMEAVAPSTLTSEGHLMGVEIGYDSLLFDTVVLRPNACLGLSLMFFEFCMSSVCTSDSRYDVFVAPGLEILYLFESAYIGAESSFTVVFAEHEIIRFYIGIMGGINP